MRKTHGLNETDTVALFVGGNWERKGLSLVLEALAASPVQHIKLLVVGSGDAPHYARLARELGIADRVTFAGHTNRVQEYYAAADLFVFPTAYEACGLVILEAAANALPLVTTAAYGAQELVVDGYNGFLVERDPRDVANKIHLVIQDPLRMKTMGENAQKSSRRYSVESMARETLTVFEEVYRRKYGASTKAQHRCVRASGRDRPGSDCLRASAIVGRGQRRSGR